MSDPSNLQRKLSAAFRESLKDGIAEDLLAEVGGLERQLAEALAAKDRAEAACAEMKSVSKRRIAPVGTDQRLQRIGKRGVHEPGNRRGI